ncbi:ferritin-like domain-containing protein [Paraburkholderia pallida]|uniref:Iminophenyl-pyruvate dimer synthase domain-containing protein n=1 Tax=Paraburkholderia pallida TaxID=2547399 RepID=A0A4P7CY38_9BURK|nr:ferritin-like protein [Paraburkholderia pallida]QBQ99144.1 hypothetical protein E1956_18160 [Paraburkholderia pallida]
MIHLKRAVLRGLTAPAVTRQSVCVALQQAIELEHSTIPLYLYALYSLDPAKNGAIAGILSSVVIEEMLHMTLASNVMNALGGSPVINEPGFIPTYPGPLPGGVEAELTVNLAPFSSEQLQAFITIEQPEDPLDFPSAALLAADATAPITIGQFYAAILAAIEQLGDGAFAKPPRNQVGPELMRESVVVYDVMTARRAIETIVEQGEGTHTSPEAVVGGGYAHYYRFMEIAKGHRLVKTPGIEPGYAYTGEAVPFDPQGVYPVPTNPTLASYPPNSAQRLACNNFNYAYTSLLLVLHQLFNGAATSAQFNTAIGLMMSLKGQAKAMMAGIPNPKLHVGPSFEYQPIDPGNAA